MTRSRSGAPRRRGPSARKVSCDRYSRRDGDDPIGRERKFAPVDLKSVAADGTFSGYASIFGKADLGGDLVEPGAFSRSLAARGVAGVKMLFQHDPAEPIGVWQELAEDGVGLYARGRLMPEVARAREVLSLMRAGALDGLSIGFRTVKGRTDPKTGIRRLSEIDLWEVSVVTFPMLPEARIEAVKRSPWASGPSGPYDGGAIAAAIRRAAARMARR
ncbi:HK97 family phage prohead protease [Microbaculum marinisediminis]|uniref:HK97 family phage prohead protease n=1 Tax=Microbaculum marinisediminis TaxID=2931392 RepID=A0AAW5QTD7_9HYPH|nr:HK97 family phage prohead protease [Microbaculum sp. A6E488]MCT8971220.1 HK97 family phage prohead protease [Microbaculum sp. A6E488]